MPTMASLRVLTALHVHQFRASMDAPRIHGSSLVGLPSCKWLDCDQIRTVQCELPRPTPCSSISIPSSLLWMDFHDYTTPLALVNFFSSAFPVTYRLIRTMAAPDISGSAHTTPSRSQPRATGPAHGNAPSSSSTHRTTGAAVSGTATTLTQSAAHAAAGRPYTSLLNLNGTTLSHGITQPRQS